MFELLFSYPRDYFEAGRVLPVSQGSVALSLALAAIALILVGVSLMRWRSRLSLGKLALIGTLQWGILMLAIILVGQPLLEIDRVRPGDNQVLFLVDNSLSMALPDETNQTRIDRLTASLESDLISPLEAEGIGVLIRSLSGEMDNLDGLRQQDNPSQSDIAHWLESSLQLAGRQALAGVVLV